MAAVKGRKMRRGVSHAVQLNARVLPDRREKVLRVAEALGISVNAYMDALIAREVLDESGRPRGGRFPCDKQRVAAEVERQP